MFTIIARKISQFTGSALAFGLAAASILLWALTGPFFDYSDLWLLIINSITTVITYLMVFIIQNSQNSDTAALHRKIDELIYAVEQADNRVIGIEKEEEITLDAPEVEHAKQSLE